MPTLVTTTDALIFSTFDKHLKTNLCKYCLKILLVVNQCHQTHAESGFV